MRRVLFLRGLRWRRGFSAAVLLVGIIGTAVAAIGPLYARSASESTLTDELHSAGADDGLAFDQEVDLRTHRPVARLESRVGTTAKVPGYAAPIRGISLLVTSKIPSQAATVFSPMVWRQGQCGHLTIVSGHCPQAAGEAIVDEDTLSEAPDWAVGDLLTVHQGIEANGAIVDGPVIAHIHIVGSYRPKNTLAGYWFDHPYFNSRLGPAATSAIKGGVDALFVQPGQFAHVPVPATGEVDYDVPIDPSGVRLATVGALRAHVAAVQRRFPRQPKDPLSPSLQTNLPTVLDNAARDHHDVGTATLVVVLELAALSLLVLFQVVGGAVEARGDEIALAKLRGLRPLRVAYFALAEPLGLLLAAVPLGVLLAFGVTHLLAATALVHGTPVLLSAATWYAVAAAFAGSVLAAGLAAVRTLTRPVLEQWRATSPPARGRRLLLVVDLVLAVLAVLALVALQGTDRGRPRPIFLLAPALLVFAVALVGVRLLPPIGRLGLRPTRASGSIASFLALRQTVRRPAGLRLAALLAVAAGLATFAICGEAVAHANREARAQTELGGARQVSAQFETGHDPQTAVNRADPDGSWAMTTATWSPDGGPARKSTIVGQLLGVDASRLPATTYDVRGQLSPSTLRAEITAGSAPSAIFTGTRLRLRMITTALHGLAPTVEFGVRQAHVLTSAIAAGRLRRGAFDYVARVPCAAGCAFTGITFDRSIDAVGPVTGSVQLLGLAVDDGHGFRPVHAELDRPSAWRATALGYDASLHISGGAQGLTATFRGAEGSSPVLSYADTPTRLPIVAAPASVTKPTRTGGVVDYSGTTLVYTVRQFTGVLPGVLDKGAIADLDYLRIRLPDFDYESAWTVWLAPDAPADAIARLKRAGLLVQDVQTESSRVAALSRQGPALGLLLLLVCAVAAAVLAVGGTAVTLMAGSRRRSFELAALRVLGVPHRSLRRASVVEQVLLLGAAIVLGLPSGYVAARLVLPVVPEFSDATPVALHYTPSVLAALACAAAFAVLLWITAVVAGSMLARAAVPARLREASR